MHLKKLHIGAYEFILVGLVVAAILLRMILIAQHWPGTNSDEAFMDLMALHINDRGEHPIFFYGQAYMGSIEAYIGALCFKIFGVSVFSLRYGLLPFFALFLICLYLLTSMLYTKRLALFVVALLSLGSFDMIKRQLQAIGGYPEIVFFGALIFLLGSYLALTSQIETQERMVQERRRRWLYYGLLGLIVGLALWTDQLILPCLFTTGLLMLLFCRREIRTRNGLFLLLGFIIGALPLIYYNISDPVHNSLRVLLDLHRSGIDEVTNQHIPALRQLIGVLLISIPTITGFNPLCNMTVFPLYGPSSPQTALCTLTQGSWSLGYLILWTAAVLIAAYPLWQSWRNRQQGWSFEQRQANIRHCAHLMLLLSAILSLLLFMLSPQAALYPTTDARYLICILISTPAILWPLWKSIGARSVQALRQARWQILLLTSKVAILIMVASMLCMGTIHVIQDIPNTQADYAQKNELINDLLRIGATRIYTDYWTCSRIIFQSNERIICSSLDGNLRATRTLNRYPPFQGQVQAAARPTYLFNPADTQGLLQMTRFERRLRQLNEQYTRYTFYGYVVYLPETRIDPY